MTRLLPMILFAGTVAFAQQPAPVPATDATADSKPLPDVAELLKAVERHEDRDDALLQQYTYHSHTVMEDYDGSDSVKKTTITDTESIPINGVRVRRVVARNGKPLTPEEAKKEDDDFNKQVDEAKKRKAKNDEKEAEAKRTGKSNDGFLPASRILELGTFSNERRVDLNGRPTIVLDYAGSRDAKTKNSLEKIVEDLAGTVWIDEQDKVLARTEGHFNADFKLGFGLLADIHKGLTFTFEQQKINGEVWLPRLIDGYGKASFGVFVARVHGHTHSEASDYRKYHATSIITGTNGMIDDNGNPIPGQAPGEPDPKPDPKPYPKPGPKPGPAPFPLPNSEAAPPLGGPAEELASQAHAALGP